MLAPELAWGLYTRLLGVVGLIALAPLAQCLVALTGSHGISPCTPVLRQTKRDFGIRAFFFFPTVLWFNSSDTALKYLPRVGMLAAVGVVVGGDTSPLCLLVLWAVLLSISSVSELPYPWDSLFLESLFLALMLPATLALPSSAAAAAPPAPIVAFAHRLLLFRVLVGFGKLKFGDSQKEDATYIRSFLIGQPIPSPVGWWAHRLPPQLFVGALAFMWVVEIPLPFALFVGGWLRTAAALGIAALMAGIQLTGNFGYFNLLTAAHCVHALDSAGGAYPSDLVSLSGWWAPRGMSLWQIAPTALLPVLLVLCPFFFLFNSWCNRGWQFWPAIACLVSPRGPAVPRALLALARALVPWRVIASYGVFYPHSSPPLKWTPVFLGSDDGETWHEFEYKVYPTGPASAPRFVAPWHPRLDHDVFYAALGMNNHNFSSTIGLAAPYSLRDVMPKERIAARLLDSRSPVRDLFKPSVFGDRPPKFVRAELRVLAPRPSVLANSNDMLGTAAGPGDVGRAPPKGVAAAAGVDDADAWWLSWRVGTHVAPMDATAAAAVWSDWLPEDPALMHPELLHWRDWSPRLRDMHTAWAAVRQSLPSAAGDTAPTEAEARAAARAAAECIAQTSALAEADVAALFRGWAGHIAAAAQPRRDGRPAYPITGLHLHWAWADALREGRAWADAHDAEVPRTRVALARAAEMLTHVWRDTYDAERLRGEKRPLIPTWFDAWLFAHVIVAHGERAFGAALLRPEAALAEASAFVAEIVRNAQGDAALGAQTYGTLFVATGTFWKEVVAWHWRSLRMVERVSSHPMDANPDPVVPGFVRHMAIVQRMPAPPGAAVDPLPSCTYPTRAGGVWTVHFDEFGK